MAQGNGLDEKEVAASAGHSKSTTFKIGGKDVRVPALTLSTLDTRDEEMRAIGTPMPIREYAKTVLRIAATSVEAEKTGEEADPTPEAIDVTYRRWYRTIKFDEIQGLSNSMDQLLINSGYTLPGEAEAATTEASPGTGTLTESPQTSQSTESAPATPSESKENLH